MAETGSLSEEESHWPLRYLSHIFIIMPYAQGPSYKDFREYNLPKVSDFNLLKI